MMIPQSILLIGITIVLALYIKIAFERLKIPALVGYMMLGFSIRLAGSQWHILSREILGIYDFLANIGVICLLFDVGLKSKLTGLLRQLRRASTIWMANVLFSGVLGYVVSATLLGLGVTTSLFIAIALTATSVGVPVVLWREANALNSQSGELMIDIAELDDLSGVVFMAVLFSLAVSLKGSGGASILPDVGKILSTFLLKFVAFSLVCLLFSLFAERHATHFVGKLKTPSVVMLLFIGTGFVISSIAGFLGFSVAIGAFFAGLVFSRDPEAVRVEGSFASLYELFVPFFFVGIGLGIDPGALTMAVGLGMLLLAAAIVGKLAGTIVPSLHGVGWTGSILIGISMVPRAEIAMVIMERGRSLGDWAVSPRVYAGMVMVTIGTCVLSSFALRPMLLKWPQTNPAADGP